MPLCSAIYSDHHLAVGEVVWYLLEQCGMRKDKDDGNPAPFFVSVPKAGCMRVVRFLVAWGIDTGTTPLFAASENGHLAIVQYLVEQGANKDKADKHNQTPLFAAAEMGHLAVVQYLVEQGADKQKADCDGVTPLQIALSVGRKEVAEYLLSAGCR